MNKRKPKVLKVGIIKKKRPANDDDDDDDDNDNIESSSKAINKTGSKNSGGGESAWNRYLKEVRKYKEKYGDDEDKNRPLVK